MNNGPDFSIAHDYVLVIHKIALRAHELNHDIDFTTLMMDMMATHKVCPLMLEELLAADVSNFAHDVGGIMRHINRKTGRLENCFVPRFAINQG